MMNKKEMGEMIIEGTDEFYRMAKSILKEDADCQDAVQEAVSKAFAKNQYIASGKVRQNLVYPDFVE